MPRPVFAVLAALVGGLLAGPAVPQEVIAIGPSNPMLPPAIDREGQTVVFGAAVDPGGSVEIIADLWVRNLPGSAVTRLTNYAGAGITTAVTSYTLSEDGTQVAYVLSAVGGLSGEIHVIDTASGSDRLLTTDKRGCVQPLVTCLGCFFPCVHDPHFTADGRVLYTDSGSQPFFLVSPTGTVTTLPVYSGYLALGQQRVISDNGLVVFTSTAPSGPVTGAGTLDAYVMNLNGAGLRNLTQFSNTNVSAQNAVISANGETIAFESNSGLTGTAGMPQIFAINADGTGLRQLTSGPDPATHASLSADGSWLAYAQSGQVKVSPTGSAGPPASVISFRYSTAQDAVLSDDGSQVAFTIGPNGGRGAIYEAPASGGPGLPVYAPVSLNSNGVEAIASWASPSPGSLISAYGLNFTGDQMVEASSFPLPPTLANVSLLVNGQPVPMEAVTPWQINAQLPQTTPAGNATFQVVANGVSHNTVTVQVPSSAPSVFTFSAEDTAGNAYWQAAAFHAGTATPADATHPAKAGETLETYGTGLGQTNPMVAAGEPSPLSPLAWAVVTPQVTIGGQPAQTPFAGLVPGLAGVYQINVVVPAGLAPGQQLLNWTVPTQGGAIFVQ